MTRWSKAFSPCLGCRMGKVLLGLCEMLRNRARPKSPSTRACAWKEGIARLESLSFFFIALLTPKLFMGDPWAQGFIPSPRFLAWIFIARWGSVLPQITGIHRFFLARALAPSAMEEDNRETCILCQDSKLLTFSLKWPDEVTS